MKSTLLKSVVLATVLALVASALAQAPGGPPGGPPGGGPPGRMGGPGGGRMGGGRRGGGPLGRMQQNEKEILGTMHLTSVQKAKLEKLDKLTVAEAAKVLPKRPMFGGPRPTEAERTAMRAKFDAFRKWHSDKLKAILTKPQFEKYEAEMKAKEAEARARWGGMRGGGRGGPGGPGGPGARR